MAKAMASLGRQHEEMNMSWEIAVFNKEGCFLV